VSDLPTTKKKRGRPVGSKNKKTLLQDAMREKTTNLMLDNLNAIAQTVIDKAIEGDLTAAKMVLDRLIPVTKAVEFNTDKLGDGGITINIAKLTANPHLSDRDEEVVDGDYTVED